MTNLYRCDICNCSLPHGEGRCGKCMKIIKARARREKMVEAAGEIADRCGKEIDVGGTT